MSKQQYALTHDELTDLLRDVEQGGDGKAIWEGVCNRLEIDMGSIEDAKTNDPHLFLASPLKATAVAVAALANGDIRGGWTSASNAEADSLCPGRHLAQRGIPDEPKGEWAETGTRIHAALAVESGALAKLSLEERETFDACREIEKKVVTQFFGFDLEFPPAKSMRHERLWIGDNPKHSGEADYIVRSGTKALIIDYKVLNGDVADSPRNMQLRDLACLVYANVPLLDSIGTAIVQPLVTHKPEICEYNKEHLDIASNDLVARILASNTPGAKRVAGKVQCQYCKARQSCPQHAAWVASLIPAISDQPGILSTPMAIWTPEQRAIAADLVGLAEKKLADIWEFLKSGQEQDAAFIPGWKMKPGNIREVVKDDAIQTLFDRFTAVGGTLPQFFGCLNVVKGSLNEATAKATGAKGKSLKAAVETLLDGLTEQKQNKPSLVKEDK